jgi:hypothetical protein
MRVQVEVATVAMTSRMVKAVRIVGATRALRMVRAQLTLWMLGTVQANLMTLSWLLRQT